MPCEWTFFRREPKPRNDMERCETLGEEVRFSLQEADGEVFFVTSTPGRCGHGIFIHQTPKRICIFATVET